jgi:hypothetical protein
MPLTSVVMGLFFQRSVFWGLNRATQTGYMPSKVELILVEWYSKKFNRKVSLWKRVRSSIQRRIKIE